MDGRLDVLGDGGGALVVPGLVPVEPPHVVRLHGAQVAPLVHQPPQPRRRRRRRLPAGSYSHCAIHLHHLRRRADVAAHRPRLMEGEEEEEEKQGTDDGERGRWGFALAFPWFGLFMPRGEEGRGTTTPGWQ